MPANQISVEIGRNPAMVRTRSDLAKMPRIRSDLTGFGHRPDLAKMAGILLDLAKIAGIRLDLTGSEGVRPESGQTCDVARFRRQLHFHIS